MASKIKAQILSAISSPGKPFFSSLIGYVKTLLFRSYCASDVETIARCKSGSIRFEEALDYFHSLLRARARARSQPSIRPFNHVLGAVSKMNRETTVVSMYKAMLLRRDVRPEVGTLNIVIKCLCRSERVDLGFSVLGFGIKSGASQNARTMNTLLQGLCSSRDSIGEATEFFRRVLWENDGFGGSVINDVTYATMINGFCKAGVTSEALLLIDRMGFEDQRVFPSVSCFSPVINRLCKEKRVDEALRVFNVMINRGVRPNLTCFNSLINGLGKSGGGGWEEAWRLISEMGPVYGVSPDVRSYNSLIDALCKGGLTREAISLADQMASQGVKPDVVTFNSLLSALCKHGQWSDSVRVLNGMRLFGVTPDTVTFNTVLNARCKEGSSEAALHLLETLASKGGFESLDPETYNALLCGLCEMGRSEDAHRLFDAMVVGGKLFPDIYTLNITLDALCNEGLMEKAQWMFDSMIENHKEVNNVTYNTLMKGYSRQGQMDKARDVFVRMALKGVFPDIISYNTLVKGYVKIKKTNDALKLLKQMVTCGLLPNHVSQTIFQSIVAYRLGPYFEHFSMR